MQLNDAFRSGIHSIGEAGDGERKFLTRNPIVNLFAVARAVLYPKDDEPQLFGPVRLAVKADALQGTRCARRAVDVEPAGPQPHGVAGRVTSPEFGNGPQVPGSSAEAGLDTVRSFHLLQIPFDRAFQSVGLRSCDQKIFGDFLMITLPGDIRRVDFRFQSESVGVAVGKRQFQCFSGRCFSGLDRFPAAIPACLEGPDHGICGRGAIRSRNGKMNLHAPLIQYPVTGRRLAVSRIIVENREIGYTRIGFIEGLRFAFG